MEALPADLSGDLAAVAAHPRDPSAGEGVRALQTHISHIFMTGERVYKLRKAVRFSFLDFSSRARRNADCLREVQLNRRLAPKVYLGVAPVREGARGFEVGPVGEALVEEQGRSPEHCVVMLRLPEDRDAQSLLAAGDLGTDQIDRLARRIARFHQRGRLGAPSPFTPAEWLGRIEGPVLENLRTLREHYCGGPEGARAEGLEAAAHGFVQRHSERFERRRREGRAVDGHGDLQLQHVWFRSAESEPLVIDCVEFQDNFRLIDAASDLAFASMDLRYRGRSDLSERLLRNYARECDDFDLYSVIHYYESYRAAVRGKVAVLAAADRAIRLQQHRDAEASARRHLDLAIELLADGRPGALVLLCGVVGTGKSSVAELLAEVAGGVVIGSDRTRKHQVGLEPHERPPAGMDLYDAGRTEAVYRGLLERARPIVESGRVAVLDATYSSAGRRMDARRWAETRRVHAFLIEARCTPELAMERLAHREAEGRDPSDAGPALYQQSVQRFEATEEWPLRDRKIVDTGDPNWPTLLREFAAALRSERGAGPCVEIDSAPD